MGQGNFKVKEIGKGKVSKWQQYAQLVVGKSDFFSFLKYELITFFFGNLSGALGLYLRSKLYPLILGKVGNNVVFGKGITLRYPHKICIGDNVIIDDNCVLDAKGEDNLGINLGNRVFIGRNTIICCKNGNIELQNRVNVGVNCELFSSDRLVVGQGTMIAGYSYLMSGGSYDYKSSIGFAEQNGYAKGATIVGQDCWLGAKAVVLDGVTIGDRSIVGAGAVVTKNVPATVLVTGVPAKVQSKNSPTVS